MGWTLATDVTGAWIGPDTPTDSALVSVWIEKAERLLRSKIPDLSARIGADPVTEPDLLGNVKDVVTEMVQEVFRNPERIRQRQEGTGPFTGSVTYGGDQPGALRVTAEQITLLSVAGISTGAFTIDMIPASSPFSGSYVSPLNDWETA
jgi:hypothetical protein